MNTTKKKIKGGFLIIIDGIDGIDGAGKSTQAKNLYNFLLSKGYDVSLYKEIGGTELAEKLKEIIFNHNLDAMTEALLFTTARRDLFVKQVLPDLNNGKIVILDRSYPSTIAYQGFAKNCSLSFIAELNKIACNNRFHDLLIIMDLSPEQALQRKSTLDKFENLDLLERARVGFLYLSELERDVYVIDATQSKNAVFNRIKQIVLSYISYYEAENWAECGIYR